MKSEELEKTTGLSAENISLLRQIIFSIPTVEDARIFGSRAKGTFKPFSDIDIALIGERVSHQDMVSIIMQIEDSMLPYCVDIVRYSAITNPALTDHIYRLGISLRPWHCRE